MSNLEMLIYNNDRIHLRKKKQRRKDFLFLINNKKKDNEKYQDGLSLFFFRKNILIYIPNGSNPFSRESYDSILRYYRMRSVAK